MWKILIVIVFVWMSRVNGRPGPDTAVGAPTKESEIEVEKVGKIGVFNHMRNLIHKFDYSNGLTNEKVSKMLKKVKELSALGIPSTINQTNEKEVASFQRRYCVCYAILMMSKSSIVDMFKKEVKQLAKTEDSKTIATLVAELFCLLSKFGGDETDDKVDWNSEDEVINALKRWSITNTDVLNIARAFHRLRKQIVKGKKIYIHAIDVEEETLTQFDNCVGKNFVLEAMLMPNAHAGYVGSPVGSVIKTKKAVVPAWVGYDIGCGVIAVKISDNLGEQNLIRENARLIFDRMNRAISMGYGLHARDELTDRVPLVEEMETALKTLEKPSSPSYSRLYDEVSTKSRSNLGSLGSGNHFIEISVNNDETWLVIHSGSRGVGNSISTHFIKAVPHTQKNYEDPYAITDDVTREQYMHYQDYCLEFALLNRLSMALKVEEVIRLETNITYDTNKNLWTNKNHNYCIKLEDDVFLHRKGATSSDKGERGVIPGNMKDGCYLVEGLGNDKFLLSSSHGAGRKMSSKKVQKVVQLYQFEEAMEGIVAPVNLETIDGSPFAYKNITGVMEVQRDSVKIVKHLKPIINWKGTK